MLERTELRFDIKPKRLAADTAYGTDRFLHTDYMVRVRTIIGEIK
jgi:hypothetical protein